MEISEYCEKDFAQVKNGDFICIWAEEQLEKGKTHLPLKWEHLIVKVIDKEKPVFIKFPQMLIKDYYSDEDLILKIIESLKLYNWFKTKENLFEELPQNFLIKSISPIKKEIIEEAIKIKRRNYQNKIDAIQASMNKLNKDLEESKLLL